MAVPGVTPLSAEENVALYDSLRGKGCALPLPEMQALLERNRRNIATYLDAPSVDFYVFFSMRTDEQLRKAVDFAQHLGNYTTFVPMDVLSDSQPDQGDLELKMLEKSRAAVGFVMDETFGWINEVSAMRAKGVPPIIVTPDSKKYAIFHENHVFRTFGAVASLPSREVLVNGKRDNKYGVPTRFTEHRILPSNMKVGLHVIKAGERHDWRQKLWRCMDEALKPAPNVYARRRTSQFLDAGVLQYACKHCHATLYEENVWSPTSWTSEGAANAGVTR